MSGRRLESTLAVALGLAACGNDLDTRPQDVKDLRVLAICADHPETFVVAESAGGGFPGVSGWPYVITQTPPPVTLTALVLDPEHTGRVFDARAVACVADGTKVACEPDAAGTVPLFDHRATTAGVQVFPFAPTAEMLNTFIAEDAYRGYGSLYVMVDLTLRAPDGETVRATKIVTYTRPGVTPGEGQPPPPPPAVNTNPALWVLEGEDDAQVLSSAEPGALRFAPGERWNTKITLAGADPEYAVPRFPTRDTPNAGYELVEEQLFLDFYAVAGRWDTASVSNRNFFGEVEELEAAYTAPRAAEDFPGTLYIVSSDDRGGCAWSRVQVLPAETSR